VRYEAIQHVPVVRDDYDRALIRFQIRFKPRDRIDVQVVGRFVEEEDIGSLEEQLCKRHPHAPAAGECTQRLLHVIRGKPEPGQHGLGARLRTLGIAGMQRSVDPIELVKQVVMPVRRVVYLRFEFAQDLLLGGLQLPDLVESRKSLFDYRPVSGTLFDLLTEISERRTAELHAPVVDGLGAGQDPEKRRLPGSVGADQADAPTVADSPREPVEQGPPSETERDAV
jgi:hypothetical protein